jgi:hypothetical protein
MAFLNEENEYKLKKVAAEQRIKAKGGKGRMQSLQG